MCTLTLNTKSLLVLVLVVSAKVRISAVLLGFPCQTTLYQHLTKPFHLLCKTLSWYVLSPHSHG